MHIFRNIVAFSFPSNIDFNALEGALEGLAFQACPAQAMSSEGFVPVLGEGTEQPKFSHQHSGAINFAVQTEVRIVPPRVVDEHLQKRLAEIEEKEGRKPGSRERKRLKEDVVASLMAQSFTTKTRTRAMIDVDRGLLLVDTASRKVAENVTSHLRSALGSFPCIALTARMSPMIWMTHLVSSEVAPEGLAIGSCCTLKGPDSAKVTIKNLDLRGQEVQGHLEAGMTISQLEMGFVERFTWVLDDALVVRNFRFTGEVEHEEHDDAESWLNAQMFLLVSNFRVLIDLLDSCMGINFAGKGLSVDDAMAAARTQPTPVA